jgi:phospholipase C
MSWLSDMWDAVTDTAGDWYHQAQHAAEDVADAAEDFATDVRDTWNDAMAASAREFGMFEALIAFFGGVVAGVLGTVGNLLSLGYNLLGALVSLLFHLVGSLVGGVVRLLITFLSGGLLSGFGKSLGQLIAEGFGDLGDWLQDGLRWIGDLWERFWDIVATLVLALTTKAICIVHSIAQVGSKLDNLISGEETPTPTGLDRVNHFFVLMLENRSFDHMLGLSGIQGVDGIDPKRDVNTSHGGQHVHAGCVAKLSLADDPPHEFSDVETQLLGGPTSPNGGFVVAFEDALARGYLIGTAPEEPEQAMCGFSPSQLPILNTLAREFAVCDRWFSSLPGPTLPNRLFVHAATSGGLADSPSREALAWMMTAGGFEFEHGTVFDSLDADCQSWRVYAGDATPLVMTLKGIATDDALNGWASIRDMGEFESDLSEGGANFPSYVFIEPNYGRFWSDFKGGNSQHPLDTVVSGERLLKDVYEALRSSPLWERSVLIVTYDEHGGFFDHVSPEAATPPGDTEAYRSWGGDSAAQGFRFDRFGVRVPAIVVSPLIPRAKIDHTTYDHSSVFATVLERFSLRVRLTERSDNAEHFGHLFSMDSPRSDCPLTLPEVYSE